MSKLIAVSRMAGCYTVSLREHSHGAMGKTYTVRYGKEVKHLVNEILAQETYMNCVMHQFNCAGFNQ